MAKQPKWFPLFRKFLANLRIQSKHAAEDPTGEGTVLKLWTSQQRVMDGIAEGLEEGIHTFYILKSRQLGVTTITMAITIFWLALNPGVIGVFVSDNDDNSVKNRVTIRTYIRSLAKFMGKSFAVVTDNKQGFTFSNGSRLDMRVAGKSKENWGEGEGYLLGHLTELSKFGKAQGIANFRHAMAPENPRSLYIFESTANGPNHWKEIWDAAREDVHFSKAIFVGWWANETNRIKMTDKRFRAFGTAGLTPEENEKVKKVKDLYDFEITMEQIAWYRAEQTKPASNEDDMGQNQPWTEDEAFITTGVSFFQPRRLMEAREKITSAPDALVEDGGYGFWGYAFHLENEYYMSRVEEVQSLEEVKLRVWEKPKKDAFYVIGVDVAGGRSEDSNNHAASVWRVFGDKLVQVAEWADSIPETRHCAWVTAYLAGQYANCYVNIDMTGGIGIAVMQAFQDLRDRLRSDMYGEKMRAAMAAAKIERNAKRAAEGLPEIKDPPSNGFGGNFDFEDFLSSSNWYMHRKIDSPGPGYVYNSVINGKIKWKVMNDLRDSWVTNLLEIRSVPLLDEMANVVQTRSDIGASAPGRERDDRTFALALANETWVENLRSGLIAQGVTWEGSKAKETGTISPVAETLNRRIYSILRAADEDRDAPPPLTFFQQRGLR